MRLYEPTKKDANKTLEQAGSKSTICACEVSLAGKGEWLRMVYLRCKRLIQLVEVNVISLKASGLYSGRNGH